MEVVVEVTGPLCQQRVNSARMRSIDYCERIFQRSHPCFEFRHTLAQLLGCDVKGPNKQRSVGYSMETKPPCSCIPASFTGRNSACDTCQPNASKKGAPHTIWANSGTASLRAARTGHKSITFDLQASTLSTCDLSSARVFLNTMTPQKDRMAHRMRLSAFDWDLYSVGNAPSTDVGCSFERLSRETVLLGIDGALADEPSCRPCGTFSIVALR